ncbi:MAG: (2Fe-2S)-binding protein [Oscillatoriales cyanobacterium]|nr:MAG: (2Fe-2S)-binding protein [Oscillatoriales cyanobacterium]
MVKVQAQGKTFECDRGSNLREVLLKNGIDLYNGNAQVINCHGLGTCGTCAVKARLSIPPHSPASNRRLSCQTKVLGDIKVTKYDGFWGQGSETVWKP